MATADTGTFMTDSGIRGYHEYKNIWEAAFGECLQCQRERTNAHDPYAAAVVKDDNVVGHVPQSYLQFVPCFCIEVGALHVK